MRTKRSTESRKTTPRRARAGSTSRIAATGAPRFSFTTWVAGIDRASIAVAGAAIVAAGVLVAAYRPAQPVETASAAEASAPTTARAATVDDTSRPLATARPSDAAATPSAAATWPAPMTITGCLDRDGDSYRLTDAAGAGVPKSRSWKSGFLKKNAAAVTLVDGETHPRLQDHLGQRVTVTGTMVNRQMQIGSMHFLSESCSEKKKV